MAEAPCPGHRPASAVDCLGHPRISSPQASSALHQTLDRLQQVNQQLQRTVIELEQVASTDKLTGAWNRRRLEECARKKWIASTAMVSR